MRTIKEMRFIGFNGFWNMSSFDREWLEGIYCKLPGSSSTFRLVLGTSVAATRNGVRSSINLRTRARRLAMSFPNSVRLVVKELIRFVPWWSSQSENLQTKEQSFWTHSSRDPSGWWVWMMAARWPSPPLVDVPGWLIGDPLSWADLVQIVVTCNWLLPLHFAHENTYKQTIPAPSSPLLSLKPNHLKSSFSRSSIVQRYSGLNVAYVSYLSLSRYKPQNFAQSLILCSRQDSGIESLWIKKTQPWIENFRWNFDVEHVTQQPTWSEGKNPSHTLTPTHLSHLPKQISWHLPSTPPVSSGASSPSAALCSPASASTCLIGWKAPWRTTTAPIWKCFSPPSAGVTILSLTRTLARWRSCVNAVATRPSTTSRRQVGKWRACASASVLDWRCS